MLIGVIEGAPADPELAVEVALAVADPCEVLEAAEEESYWDRFAWDME